MLEEENGRGRKTSGQYVGTLLADHRSLRLAVLNSCEGGRASQSDPFAGAAQSLIQQGLPAVVAMQFVISDDAAAVFAQEFYLALAGGYPVDAALAEGRRAIFAKKTNAEWGIPVLFMRAQDGTLFQVAAHDEVSDPNPIPASDKVVDSPASVVPPMPTPESEGEPPSGEQAWVAGWRTLLLQYGIRPRWLTRALQVAAILLIGLILLVVFSPVVYEFDIEPSVVEAGTPVVMRWESSRFASVKLIGADLADVEPEPKGTAVVLPMRSTTYRVESRNLLNQLGLPFLRNDSVELPVFVTPVSPQIQLSLDQDWVIPGDSVVVAWKIERADSAVLYINGIPQPLPTQEFIASRVVEPKTDTVVRIEASHPLMAEQLALASVFVAVMTPTPTPLPNPQVLVFDVYPSTVTAGEAVLISWRVINAPSVSIEGIGAQLPPEGSRQVFPAQSTTYLLQASTPGGQASQEVPVTVLAPVPTSGLTLPESAAVVSREIEGVTFVSVPAGDFSMGSLDGEGQAEEQPPHTVYLDDFWIGRTEVTNAQYARCVEAGGCSAPDNDRWNTTLFADHPVIAVSWDSAMAYTRWFTELSGVIVRLPTEAEWEKACRGDDARLYPWGDTQPEAGLLNFNQSGIGSTATVGSYPEGVSPYGALDMAGNVWEWVGDWYDGNYYGQSQEQNPTGPESGNTRTNRGGSYANDRYDVRCAYRESDHPRDQFTDVGFRVVSQGK